MKRITTIISLFLVAVTMGLAAGDLSAAVLPAGTTKTLSVGTASGNVGDTVGVDITIDDPTGIGGAAFTLLYDPAIFSFAGIEQVSKPISDGSDCQDATSGEYTACDATTIGDTMFYQTNDVKDQDGNPVGKVLVAAASANELTSSTLFRANFTILDGNGPYPIRLVRTIIDNAAAGYTIPTPIEPLVGMPAEQPNEDGYYPTPVIATILEEGTITVNAPGYVISGSVTYPDGSNADGSTVALKQSVGSVYVFIDQTVVQSGAYKFANRPAGEYQVVASPADPAYFPASANVTVAAADITQDFILPQATRYSGTVTVNGSPLPGVRVRVTASTGPVIAVFPPADSGYFATRPLDPPGPHTPPSVYATT